MGFNNYLNKITFTHRVLRRPITVIMLSLLMVGFGLFSLSKLKTTLYPSFNIPIIAISTNYSNVSPEDMVRLLVKPIEGAVSSVDGIDELESRVSRGSGFIILRLEEDAEIRSTKLEVREAIDRIRSDLPREASEPRMFQFDPELRPIMRLSMNAKSRGLDELRNIGVDFVEPRMERLEGVSSVDTRGGLERTIKVEFNQRKLAQHGLIPSDIQNAISSNNVLRPIGHIVADRTSYSIRAESMYQNVDQIRQTIINNPGTEAPIRVKDVADVTDGFAEINSLEKVDGDNSVTLEVQKRSDANTLDVTEAVLAELPKIKSQLPSGVNFRVLSNEGEYVENSINNLSQSALQALVVVIIILLLFMGGWRTTLVVALSIPLSITATFAAMYGVGLTLNIISITGLALAIGLLVDNSIVVSESIAGKLEQGYSRYQAALYGTNEVIGALLGSTLTTLGVFVPILSVSGFAGMVARDLALTICISITISFIASIILIPVLASLLLNKAEFQRHSATFRWMHKLESYYTKSLRWLLTHKYVALIFVIAVGGGVYGIYQTIPGAFFPETDSGEIDVDVELPTGTKLVRTAHVINSFSVKIQGMQDVEAVVSSIGRSWRGAETNRGEISVKLVEGPKRKSTTKDISLKLRDTLDSPGVELDIENVDSGPSRSFGGGIRLSLIGSDIDVLKGYANRIRTELMKDENVISVNSGRSDPSPQLTYFLNREFLNKIGASYRSVANEIKNQTLGTRAGYYRDEGREIPIRIRTKENTVTSRNELLNMAVHQISDQRIPVSAIGHLESSEGVDDIIRRERETVYDLSVNVKGNFQEYRNKIQEIITGQFPLPDGYRYSFSGSGGRQRESQQDLMFALIFALLLTYMIMGAQFENLKDPFIVMFTIPLAFFGSLSLLYLTNTPLSIPASIGVVILIGIVVNNGIVLVDYIHQYTRQKEGTFTYFENLLEASRRRMRPILLTALTTICSMIPLALELGAGSETWSPLARSVIGGLIFSTILSLYVIPSFVVGISQKRRLAEKQTNLD